jgi:glucosamine--fructose-6-phosphate aminotransferase (isomerizing)
VPECIEVAKRDLLRVDGAESLHRADGTVALSVSGELTRNAIRAQPEWLRGVPERVGDRRLPAGRVVFTGCGTSFYAAQTGGEALQALDAVLSPPEADLLVVLSHEGGTRLAIEAVEAFEGPVWLVTGKDESPLADLAAEVIVATPAVEESYCHTASYTCAVAALDALRGGDVRWLRLAVENALSDPFEGGDWERVAVVGAGRDWPTAQEAALKLREGAYVAAEAHHTEQILHGHLAAIDETVRVFVLEGEDRAAERAADVVRALEEIGAETTLVPTAHPAVDIVPFQLLTVELAQRRGVDPDKIRWDDPRWDAARKSYA